MLYFYLEEQQEKRNKILDEADVEEEKRDLITREIGKFREIMKVSLEILVRNLSEGEQVFWFYNRRKQITLFAVILFDSLLKFKFRLWKIKEKKIEGGFCCVAGQLGEVLSKKCVRKLVG